MNGMAQGKRSAAVKALQERISVADAIAEGVCESMDGAIRPALEGGFLYDAIREGVRDAFVELLIPFATGMEAAVDAAAEELKTVLDATAAEVKEKVSDG